MQDQSNDTIAEIADSMDSISAMLNLPLPPQMHLDQIKTMLPDWSKKLKGVYIEENDDNPWRDTPFDPITF